MDSNKPATAAQKALGDFAPKLLSLTDQVLFGDIRERTQLSKRDRSLITCAALVATGLVGLVACASAPQPEPAVAAPPPAEGLIVVSRPSERPPTLGAATNFTGKVVVQPLFQTTPHTRALGASVSFESGARTAWHTHPAGQTLVVTAGSGWVQQWNGERQEIKAGDVVWTPPGVKHWHGATTTEAMTHTAIQEQVEGKVVDWMEQVTDEQYRGATAPKKLGITVQGKRPPAPTEFSKFLTPSGGTVRGCVICGAQS